jgi:hypothetical protein
MTCLDRYRDRYGPLIADLRRDVEEFLSTGQMTRTRKRSQVPGQHSEPQRMAPYSRATSTHPSCWCNLDDTNRNRGLHRIGSCKEEGWDSKGALGVEELDAHREIEIHQGGEEA